MYRNTMMLVNEHDDHEIFWKDSLVEMAWFM
jgi:hypothetical protein